MESNNCCGNNNNNEERNVSGEMNSCSDALADITTTSVTATTSASASDSLLYLQEDETLVIVDDAVAVSPTQPHPRRHPPATQQPPLPTLLESGNLPTYKNQAESMISTYVPMAVATNVVVAVDDTNTATTDENIMMFRQYHVRDADVVIRSRIGRDNNDNNSIIVGSYNYNNSNTIRDATLASTSTESLSSSMNRRLDDQYRHLVVASYEGQVISSSSTSFRTNALVAEEPPSTFRTIRGNMPNHLNCDTMNHDNWNSTSTTTENDCWGDIQSCDTNPELLDIQRRKRRRLTCWSLSLLVVLTLIIAISLSTRHSNTSNPTPTTHHHPDDETQSMMTMSDRNNNSNTNPQMIPTPPLQQQEQEQPIYSTEELYTAVDEYIQLQINYNMRRTGSNDPNDIHNTNDNNNMTTSDVPFELLNFRYGYPMNVWDVSHVTNFTSVFDGERNDQLVYYFNENLSHWNVTAGTIMFRMFAKLNIYIGYGLEYWNVGTIRNMRSMFHDAYIFQGNISYWDVSNVQNFDKMFTDAHLFNTDLSNWNTTSAQSMSSMFQMAQTFNQNISQWNVHNVIDFSQMFVKARDFNSDISKWNTSSAIDMHQMFANTYMFNQDISLWNIEHVTQLYQMFTSSIHFNHSLCRWGEQLQQQQQQQQHNRRMVNTSGMFDNTSCLVPSDPIFVEVVDTVGEGNLDEHNYGPFCHPCD